MDGRNIFQALCFTVQQTSSGQNLHTSSVLTPALLATKQTKRTLPSLTVFFYGRVVKLIDAFYTGVLGATEYLFSFEWQLMALAGFQVHLILSKF